MIQSLFILNDSGEVVIEKHYRSGPSRSVCDVFWRHVMQYKSKQHVPPVITAPKCYLVNIFRARLFFLAVVTSEVPALYVIEFLHRVFDVLAMYFTKLTEDAVIDNFTTVYQVIEEMMETGIPLLTEPNVLTSMVAPPSILGRMVTAMSGKSAVASTLPPGCLTPTPWRRVGVKYTQNEVFLDMVESVDATIRSNGQVVSCSVHGVMKCTSKLSGMPDLSVSFQRPDMVSMASLHPCVRVARWDRERVLSFVPPDGKFRLGTYVVPLGRPVQVPFYCRATATWGDAPGSAGKLSVQLGSRPMHSLVTKRGQTGRAAEASVEEIVVRVPLPSVVIGADVRTNTGAAAYDEAGKECVWRVGKLSKEKSPQLSATLTLPAGVMPPRDQCMTLSLSFEVPSATVSGLKVAAIHVANERYTPFKGIRGMVKSGVFEMRL